MASDKNALLFVCMSREKSFSLHHRNPSIAVPQSVEPITSFVHNLNKSCHLESISVAAFADMVFLFRREPKKTDSRIKQLKVNGDDNRCGWIVILKWDLRLLESQLHMWPKKRFLCAPPKWLKLGLKIACEEIEIATFDDRHNLCPMSGDNRIEVWISHSWTSCPYVESIVK